MRPILAVPAVLALLAAGCNDPRKADLSQLGAQPAGVQPASRARPCRIEFDPLVDRRVLDPADPAAVVEGNTTSGPFVILLVFNLIARKGTTFTADADLSQPAGEAVSAGLARAVGESRLFAGDGPAYRVVPELVACHGAMPYSFFFACAPGGGGFARRDSGPAGYAALRLTVRDPAGAEVGSALLDASFLYSPVNPYGGDNGQWNLSNDPTELEGQRNLCVEVAARRLLEQVPLAIDRIIGSAGGPAVPAAAQPASAFTIMRLTREYDFAEVARVEFDTGRILSDVMLPYRQTVVSKPDEWVVPPWDEQGHWLAADAYRAQVGRLAARYQVAIEDNLTSARFRGIRAR